MNLLLLEMVKTRRTGALFLLPAAGGAGGLLALVSLRLSGGPAEAGVPLLLARCWGMPTLLNMLALILAPCVFWHVEFESGAFRKLGALPVSLQGLYLAKLLLLTAGLLAAAALETGVLAVGCPAMLPPGALARFTGRAVLLSLPALTAMQLAASRLENMWVSLGLGAAGFLSAMALANAGPAALVHPFVLLLLPVLRPENTGGALAAGLTAGESVVFLLWGMLTVRKGKN